MDIWTDRWQIDGRIDEWIDGWLDGWIDGWMDRQRDSWLVWTCGQKGECTDGGTIQKHDASGHDCHWRQGIKKIPAPEVLGPQLHLKTSLKAFPLWAYLIKVCF